MDQTVSQPVSIEDFMARDGSPVTTAFLVYQTPEGQWAAAADYEDIELKLDRKATLDDIISGVSAVKVGATAQHTAMTTLFMMQQQAVAMQRQSMEQQAAANVSKLIDPTKLRNPRA